MAQIYDTLKGFMTSSRMSKAAETLGVDGKTVSATASALLPSLLGLLMKKGATPRITDVLSLAKGFKSATDLDGIFEGHGVVDGVNIGERMENALLEGESSNLMSVIASTTKIEGGKLDRLSNWVSATIAGFFGEKIAGGATIQGLLGDLKNEKSAISKDLPLGLASKFGLSSILGDPIVAKPTLKSGVEKPIIEIPKKKKKKNGWIWWLLLLLLLLLLFFCWKSCCKGKLCKSKATQTEQVIATPIAPVAATAAARPMTEVTLPDGTKLNVFHKGTECQMSTYLKSDNYRNATLESLKKNWFRFDNIEFKHNSSTEFMDGTQSSSQLDNIVCILNNYPDAKIVIAGYADKTGSKAINSEISRARANFIKSYLSGKGINAGRLSTEGFGEEFATHPADSPDAERAMDRDIALRFNK